MKRLFQSVLSAAMILGAASAMAEPTEVTDCETILTEAGEYVLTHDLVCPDSDFAVRLNGADISLDCDGHHITESVVGVDIRQPNAVVENCIIHDLTGENASTGINMVKVGPNTSIINNIVYGVGRFGLSYYLSTAPEGQIADNVFCFTHEDGCATNDNWSGWEAVDIMYYSNVGDLAEQNTCDYLMKNNETCETALPCATTCEMVDPDGDQIPDGADNCPDDFNPEQEDADNNGIGDVCEEEEPMGLGWDESADAWSLINGVGSISENALLTTFGTVSLQMDGDGYRTFESATVSTDDIAEGSASLAMDVYVDSSQANPYWVGAVQLYVHCPSAGVYNEYQGQVELSSLPFDEFVEVEFPLNAAAIGVLADTYDDLSIRVSVLTNPGSAPVLIDNIWFY